MSPRSPALLVRQTVIAVLRAVAVFLLRGPRSHRPLGDRHPRHSIVAFHQVSGHGVVDIVVHVQSRRFVAVGGRPGEPSGLFGPNCWAWLSSSPGDDQVAAAWRRLEETTRVILAVPGME